MQSPKIMLEFNLCNLEKARAKLARDFIEENPEVYQPMFRYENSKEQMKLAKEKYIMTWLDSHWNLVEESLRIQEVEIVIQNEIRHCFTGVFLRLLEKFDMNSSLSIELLKEKIENLQKILTLGDKHENMINKLLYDADRHKRIFQRKFDELKGGQNESF